MLHIYSAPDLFRASRYLAASCRISYCLPSIRKVLGSWAMFLKVDSALIMQKFSFSATLFLHSTLSSAPALYTYAVMIIDNDNPHPLGPFALPGYGTLNIPAHSGFTWNGMGKEEAPLPFLRLPACFQGVSSNKQTLHCKERERERELSCEDGPVADLASAAAAAASK